MGNSGALKRRSHGSTADIATVQARSPKNGITPGKIEALNLRLQTRPIQLSHWPAASRQRPKIPDRISERPPRGGLSDSGISNATNLVRELVAFKFLGYETKPDGAAKHQTDWRLRRSF